MEKLVKAHIEPKITQEAPTSFSSRDATMSESLILMVKLFLIGGAVFGLLWGLDSLVSRT